MCPGTACKGTQCSRNGGVSSCLGDCRVYSLAQSRELKTGKGRNANRREKPNIIHSGREKLMAGSLLYSCWLHFFQGVPWDFCLPSLSCLGTQPWIFLQVLYLKFLGTRSCRLSGLPLYSFSMSLLIHFIPLDSEPLNRS